MNLNPECKKVLCLMGPTASGKTKLAIELSKIVPVRLISVDSAQVYKGLDIGSGKLSREELEKYPHDLIDIRAPCESYSAHQFCQDALASIERAFEENRLPVLVGGTMLYFKALLQGLSPLPSSDPLVRDRLLQEAIERGWPQMHKKLQACDPVTAARLKPNDKQRIHRALEVFEISGMPLSHWHRIERKSILPYETICIGLMPAEHARPLLHQNIAERFHMMLEEGFVEEVSQLLKAPSNVSDLPAFKSVGYRQVIEMLEGKIPPHALPEKGIASTRQLAKRQLTWMRSWKKLHTIDCFSEQTLEKLCHHLQDESVF